jgi:hypothetical protein
VSSTGTTPTLGGSVTGGAPSTSGPQDVTEGHGLQDPSVQAAHGDRTLVQESMPETELSTTADAVVSSVMGEAAISGFPGLAGLSAGAPSSPPWMGAATALVGADDDAAEELEVILGHPILRAPGGCFPLQINGHDPLGAKPGARCALSGEGGH